MIYIRSIIFYGKELTCHEAADLSVSFNRHACSVGLIQHRSCDIFIYLELAFHDEQNGGQSLKIGARSYGNLKRKK